MPHRVERFMIAASFILGDVADDNKLFRLRASRASDGICVVSSDQVYGDGDSFTYGHHTW